MCQRERQLQTMSKADGYPGCGCSSRALERFEVPERQHMDPIPTVKREHCLERHCCSACYSVFAFPAIVAAELCKSKSPTDRETERRRVELRLLGCWAAGVMGRGSAPT